MSPANLLHPAETTEHDPVSAMEVEISDELELNDDAPPQSLVTPIVIPPRPSASDDDVPSPQRMRVLELLVRMADQYARNGMVRQAIELFFELLTDHAGTEQADHAGDQLLGIAQQYEANGELRQARGIYERLLKVS